MGTGAKWCPVKLKPTYDALGPNKTISSTRVSYTYWSRHQWTQNTGKAKTYILKNVHESFRRCDQRPWWLCGWNVSVRTSAMWLWTGPVSYHTSYLMQVRWHMFNNCASVKQLSRHAPTFWTRRASVKRRDILQTHFDLTFNCYFNTYIAGITSFYFHQNNGCIGFIILQNI